MTHPTELLTVSDVMLGTTTLSALSEQVRLRQAASRAYYAAFHIVHASLATRSRIPGYRINHAPLIDWAVKSRNNQLRSIGLLLRSAKRLRVSADYELSMALSDADVQTMVVRLRAEVINREGQIAALVMQEPNRIPDDREGLR